MGFEDGWSAFEQQVGPLLTDELSQDAPISDSETDPAPGTLANSMEWQDQDGTLTVGSSDPRGPIAAYVTRGTAPHEIVPVAANALHFFVGGDEVFTRHVDHPGTSPNPFHITAWENQRDTVMQMFHDTVGASVLSMLNPWRNATLGEGDSPDDGSGDGT